MTRQSNSGGLHLVLVSLCLVLLTGPAAANEIELELVLAVDVSASVNDEEFALQRAGTAAAFRDPEVQQAVEQAPGGIAVTVFQWASQGYQRVAIPWRHLDDAAAVEAYAGEVARMPRLISGGGTMIHTALAFAQNLFASSPLPGRRRVIDLTGNGEADNLPAMIEARDSIVAEGTVINALAIEELQADLTSYFRVNLIGGPGAFVETAEDFDDFVHAMRLKLLREVGDQRMSHLEPRPARAGLSAP